MARLSTSSSQPTERNIRALAIGTTPVARPPGPRAVIDVDGDGRPFRNIPGRKNQPRRGDEQAASERRQIQALNAACHVR